MKLTVEPYPRRRKTTKAKSKPKKRIKYPQVLEKLQKELVRKIYGTDCYTCPAKDLQGSNCQLGHVPWPRSQLSTICKFDYRFTRMQCFKCNIWDKGRGADALMRMVEEGIDVQAMKLENENTKGAVCGKKYYEDRIAIYEALITLER